MMSQVLTMIITGLFAQADPGGIGGIPGIEVFGAYSITLVLGMAWLRREVQKGDRLQQKVEEVLPLLAKASETIEASTNAMAKSTEVLADLAHRLRKE